MIKVKSKRETIFYDWVNAMNLHSMDKILSLLSEDIEIKSNMFGHWNGKSNVKVLLCDAFSAFPNLFVNPVAVFSNGGGDIASEVDFGGTQMGKFNGNPGLGHKFHVRGVFVFDFNENDKVVGVRSYYDSRSINRQLEIMSL